ncbi:MAG: hypothetical protein EBU08_18235 [Micrococcales bacterium]|nr:hypothetical protein [Micrococcales bacterium]
MLNPTGSFLEMLLVEGEVIDIYPLSPTDGESKETALREALISYDDVNYHVKFTSNMIPTGDYSVAEDIYSDDRLAKIEEWQEQLLKDLKCGPDDDPDLIEDWDSIDDFSDVEGWDDEDAEWDELDSPWEEEEGVDDINDIEDTE